MTDTQPNALDKKLDAMKREYQEILKRAQGREALEKELWITLMRAHSAESIMVMLEGQVRRLENQALREEMSKR
jgi:hypothetical protein